MVTAIALYRVSTVRQEDPDLARTLNDPMPLSLYCVVLTGVEFLVAFTEIESGEQSDRPGLMPAIKRAIGGQRD